MLLGGEWRAFRAVGERHGGRPGGPHDKTRDIVAGRGRRGRWRGEGSGRGERKEPPAELRKSFVPNDPKTKRSMWPRENRAIKTTGTADQTLQAVPTRKK